MADSLRSLTILGATGSVGASALDVIARHRQRFRLHAVTAQSNVNELADIAAKFDADIAVIGDPNLERPLRDALQSRGARALARGGRAALVEVAQAAECDTVLAAIVAPMALYTTYQGLRGRIERHVRIARWTLPIWLYVSITGVAVYWMLYRLYPPE